MKPPITFEEAERLFKDNVDRDWYAEFTSTPEGQALVRLIAAPLIEADATAYTVALALRKRGASRATRSKVTLRITRGTNGVPLTLPAGTRVKSDDGIVYLTDAPAVFRARAGQRVDVTATAEIAGPVGAFPVGTLTLFDEPFPTLSGAGLGLDTHDYGVSGGLRAALLTDTTVPNPFMREIVGLYVELRGFTDGFTGNNGRLMPVGVVSNGGGPLTDSVQEGPFAFSTQFTDVFDPFLVGLTTGTTSFEWRVRTWSSLGFEVTNITEATRGEPDTLDSHAADEGVLPYPGETTESLRARLDRQPDPPTPIGLLRAAVESIAAWGLGIADVQIFEAGAKVPSALDKYAPNFPPFAGFISDVHPSDMPTVDTPDFLAQNIFPSYVNDPTRKNMGPALTYDSSAPLVIVRWTSEGLFDEAEARSIRLAILRAISDAKRPGAVVVLQLPPQGYGIP